MAIQRNAVTSGGKRISEPGEYRVHITELKTKASKKGDPMLVVTFQTEDEKEICGYFVKKYAFQMKALAALKQACGLKDTDSADKLIAKECGLLVESGETNEKGHTFMEIVGYGPASDAASSQQAPEFKSDADENIPF